MDILTVNPILTAAIISWAISLVLRSIIQAVQYKKADINRIFVIGEIPSSHTALVTAAAGMTLRICGLKSSEFALAALFALITIYDTAGVRYNIGLHTMKINHLQNIIKKLIDQISLKYTEKSGGKPFELPCRCFRNDFSKGKNKNTIPLIDIASACGRNKPKGSKPMGILTGTVLGIVVSAVLPC